MICIIIPCGGKIMGKNILKRGFIISVVCMFLSTICLPVLASELFNVRKDINEKATSEEKIVDSNREIITSVHGSCTEITIKGLGFIRRAEIWAGCMKTVIVLDGFKSPLFINHNYNYFWTDRATHIIIPYFIGFRMKMSITPTYGVYGIALGNIDWE
jgi:hypothetical protein